MNATVTPAIYASLNRFMQFAPSGIGADQKKEIESFFAYCKEGMDTDSQKLLATLLIKALNKRIHSVFIGENIYLGKYEVSQIQLFNILIEQFPFVKYSQQIVNTAIVKALEGQEEATIIDIGIGLGTQVANIIERARSLPQLKTLHVIGVEPFGDALAKAEQSIQALNGRMPFRITFKGVCDSVENIDFSSLGYLSGTVIVNASLALHHIQSDEQRTATISRIKRQVNPDAFFLIEPNVDHFEPDFHTRFRNCYNHFYALFQVTDRIDASEEEKNALKLFFGREIEDVIGKEEKARFEKHEPATRWIERLLKNRFSIKTDFLQTAIEPGCGVEIRFHPNGFLGFTYQDETALAVICAQ